MKALLLKRGDVMRVYGVTDHLMRAIEKSKALAIVRVKGYQRRLYRRADVERFVLGSESGERKEERAMT